jgi:hypothetical protein
MAVTPVGKKNPQPSIASGIAALTVGIGGVLLCYFALGLGGRGVFPGVVLAIVILRWDPFKRNPQTGD